MDNMLCIKFLQIRKQPVLYLFPMLIFYFLLLPYQRQVVIGSDEGKALELFLLVEKMVIIFSIWYQYLDFQMILYRDLKEIAFVNFTMSHFKWFLFSRTLYFCLLMPFFLIFKQTGSYYFENCIAIFILQIMEISAITFLIIVCSHSSLIGAMLASCCFFICANGNFTEPCNMIVMDVNPYIMEKKWFLFHGIIASVLLAMELLLLINRRSTKRFTNQLWID